MFGSSLSANTGNAVSTSTVGYPKVSRREMQSAMMFSLPFFYFTSKKFMETQPPEVQTCSEVLRVEDQLERLVVCEDNEVSSPDVGI